MPNKSPAEVKDEDMKTTFESIFGLQIELSATQNLRRFLFILRLHENPFYHFYDFKFHLKLIKLQILNV